MLPKIKDRCDALIKNFQEISSDSKLNLGNLTAYIKETINCQ